MSDICACENCDYVGEESQWTHDVERKQWNICPGCGSYGTNYDCSDQVNLTSILRNSEYKLVKIRPEEKK